MEEKRFCLECGEPLVGRIDKKFCSDYCRNAYNNRLNRKANEIIRKTNARLKKNWKILEKLNPSDKTKIHKNKLLEEGFDFRLMTEIYQTKKGDTYYYVYNQGYLKLTDDFYMLVRKFEKN